MPIKDIFTIIDSYSDTIEAAGAALEIAARNQAHVTGLALAMEPLSPGFLSSPIPAEYLVEAIEAAENSAKNAVAAFQEKAAAMKVDAEARSATIYSGGTPVIVRQAQLSDLIVVGQEDPDKPEPMRSALIEALLFDSGVPMLLVPHGWNKSVSLEKVLIAWDGASTSARAVHAALPALLRSKSAEVVMVEGTATKEGEPAADVSAYLARHGIKVSVTTLPRSKPEVSSVLLDHIAATGVDYCVMGAYGHNRFREFVIGGVTRDILEKMTVPTLMIH